MICKTKQDKEDPYSKLSRQMNILPRSRSEAGSFYVKNFHSRNTTDNYYLNYIILSGKTLFFSCALRDLLRTFRSTLRIQKAFSHSFYFERNLLFFSERLKSTGSIYRIFKKLKNYFPCENFINKAIQTKRYFLL